MSVTNESDVMMGISEAVRHRRQNRRIGGLEFWHLRLEKVARMVLANADEVKDLFLVAPLDMLGLRAVLADKPAPYERADLDTGRQLLFDTLRMAIGDVARANAAVAGVEELVRAEVEHALLNVGASEERTRDAVAVTASQPFRLAVLRALQSLEALAEKVPLAELSAGELRAVLPASWFDGKNR